MNPKLWAVHCETRWGDDSISLHLTEREAWTSLRPLWEDKDEDASENLNKMLAEGDIDAFREAFWEAMDSSGHRISVEEVPIEGDPLAIALHFKFGGT